MNFLLQTNHPNIERVYEIAQNKQGFYQAIL